jgi:hypothetical protein
MRVSLDQARCRDGLPGDMRLVTRFKISVPKLTTTMLILSGCLLIARVFLFHEHALAEEHGVVDIILCQ